MDIKNLVCIILMYYKQNPTYHPTSNSLQNKIWNLPDRSTILRKFIYDKEGKLAKSCRTDPNFAGQCPRSGTYFEDCSNVRCRDSYYFRFLFIMWIPVLVRHRDSLTRCLSLLAYSDSKRQIKLSPFFFHIEHVEGLIKVGQYSGKGTRTSYCWVIPEDTFKTGSSSLWSLRYWPYEVTIPLGWASEGDRAPQFRQRIQLFLRCHLTVPHGSGQSLVMWRGQLNQPT